MSTAIIPVILEDEAARRLGVLNAQNELEVMFEWVRNNVPGLRGIRLRTYFDRSPLFDNQVVIEAYCDWDKQRERVLPEWEFSGWKCQNLPFSVAKNVLLACTFQPMPEQ